MVLPTIVVKTNNSANCQPEFDVVPEAVLCALSHCSSDAKPFISAAMKPASADNNNGLICKNICVVYSTLKRMATASEDTCIHA